MPPSFWQDYPFPAPKELEGKCNDAQPIAIPAHLRGCTIRSVVPVRLAIALRRALILTTTVCSFLLLSLVRREIVMKLEQPGWRMAGPFPLPEAPLQAESWAPEPWDMRWTEGTMRSLRA